MIKRPITLAVLALLIFPLSLGAQWRVGVNAGALYNRFSMDKQYMTDYRYGGAWGVTTGVSAQYNFTPWLGVRTGLSYGQRNYRHTRTERADRLDVLYRNSYFILPVMANFSFGGKAVRGFTDLGVYGGCWTGSHRSGQEFVSTAEESYSFSEKLALNPEKDRRLDFGFAGGMGIEWQVASHWAVMAEAFGYYSVVSTVKQYMHVKDYRYNTSLGLQAGVYYKF